jgi:organic radical activating enzyme
MDGIMDKIKIRSFPEENYRAIYFNGKTIRQRYDTSKPIKELSYPEFYDIGINDKCHSNCPWCYMDAKSEGVNFENVLEKINSFFGSMTENEKPFQIAIGASGEPTLHPQFINILKTFYNLGITPNYTTNGMHITQDIIDATVQYCGGVAVSCHPHLTDYWTEATQRFYDNQIRTNLHIIISDKESIDRFKHIYYEYKNITDYFVLLPHTARGRAKEKVLEYECLFNVIDTLKTDKIAFGALFYPYLKKQKKRFDLSLYEPELMSKYLDLKDMKIYKSSFSDV